MNSKFFNVSYNKTSKIVNIDIYGAIVGGGKDSKWDNMDVTIEDFKEALEEKEDFDTINININSPGGSVFTAVAMMSILQKHQKKGVTVNAYIDGLAASAASFLAMVADNIYIGKSAMLMIHKPLISSLFFVANATKLRKIAKQLDDMEDGSLINAYMSKATDELTEKKIKSMLEEETWLSSDEAKKYFDIELIEDELEATACLDNNGIDILSKYKNLPSNIKDLINKKKESNENQPIFEKKAKNNKKSNPTNSKLKEKIKLELELI